MLCSLGLLALAALTSCAPAATQRDPRSSPPSQLGPRATAPSIASLSSTEQPAASTRLDAIGEPVLLGGAGYPALAVLYRRLDALKAGRLSRVRIAHWGDSHVAADWFTGRLRSLFQRRFGDAGPGFVLLGRPWRSYRHDAARYGSDGHWRTERVWSRYGRRHRQPRDDLFGVPGVSVHTIKPARTWAEPRRGYVDVVALHYLRQPNGGPMELWVDNKRLRRVSTRGRTKSAGCLRLALRRPGKRVEIRSDGKEVRLYGVDLLRNTPGVVYDTFGLNGARATIQQEWNAALMEAQLRRLEPDLVVLAYGSNEVDHGALTRAGFNEAFTAVVRRMKRLAKRSCCLVVGPPDQARREDDGPWITPESLALIIDEQRRIARAHGCAFWDQQRAMGGAGAMLSWAQAEPPLAQGDHIHMTRKGYELLGEALFEALLAGFERSSTRQGRRQTP